MYSYQCQLVFTLIFLFFSCGNFHNGQQYPVSYYVAVYYVRISVATFSVTQYT